MKIKCRLCGDDATRFCTTTKFRLLCLGAYCYADFDQCCGIDSKYEITKEEYLAKLAMEAL